LDKIMAIEAPKSTSTSNSGSFNAVPDTDRSRLSSARKHGQARQQSHRSEAERKRDEDLGGIQLQLSVLGDIPGYHLYWENDDNGAIEKLLSEGFDFVTQDEIQQRKSLIVPDLDISSCISRFVKGRREDGTALRAYLLKCADEIWAARESRRYKQADAWDKDIREGKIHHGDGRYKPKGTEIDLNTQFSKSY
jgi:hypothetical protein